MTDWRTNRRTRQPFPVAQGPDAIEREQLDDANEGEILPQEEEQYACAACGKPFVGQAYEIDGQIICPECNRLDNKLQREEQRRQAEDNALDDSGQGGLAIDDKEEAKAEKESSWWGAGLE